MKIGDLVEVYRPSLCCGCTKGLGAYFVVTQIRALQYPYCRNCGEFRTADIGVVGHPNHYFWKERCRVVPPLSELEGKQTQELLKSPILRVKERTCFR